ncbi:hypothetical protein Purlil1_10907 [Purpureocillium lilacinum]|uniref:NACHT-NTPase and P-loop NTPases N-terminal domain-containing protein n=1 Tax=Purpureocillium lilacinum TaxID=33203 RepID=A0ABR0BLC4_PURLI|nr:hypothetical protein Purlil1_10907 [Purpureocillium lilacinum]
MLSSIIDAVQTAGAHYESVKDDMSLREAFHGAGRGLSLVNQALRSAQYTSRGASPRAMELLNSCQSKGESSEQIFRAVAEAPKTLRLEEYQMMVRQTDPEHTVETLVVGMMRNLCAVADDLAIQNQVKGLKEAIKHLSRMEPSIPKEWSGDIFTHYGSGDMLNAPNGTVNKSEGHGNHFPGASFTGTVSFVSK